ncbi:MAG: ATP synthase F1 subunit gamma [Eubacteriaceae bacterium]|nr:ATP synthase F1 subunit gamma [Eubacteriaceae bacterium]
MADSMRDIKGRIKSVSSTKQITHAMQLVASAKLRRTRERADARRAYTRHIIETMHVIASGMDSQGENVSIFLKNNDSDRDLFVVIASDKGLAGGFNSNVLKYSMEKMAEISENPVVFAVGVKSVDFFTRRRYEIAGSYTGESENPSLTLARNIGSAVTTMFIEQKINRVFVVYNRFVSVMSQVPDIIQLLPLTGDSLSMDVVDTTSMNEEGSLVDTERVTKLKSVMIFEPDAEMLMEDLVPRYFDNAIYGALLESAAGELAARRMAMENATDNADELIGSLTLQYNRARQGAITQELTEIISGADAIS